MYQYLLSSICFISVVLSIDSVFGTVVVSPEGKKFSIKPVAGNGNCAFTAIGKTREEVVRALREEVNASDMEAQQGPFMVALLEELQESGMKARDLSSKSSVIQAIDSVFSKNSGRTSWLPVGLIMGVNERLGLNISVWSSRGEATGKVRLLQASTVNAESPMVHIVWSGGHFDGLVPS